MATLKFRDKDKTIKKISIPYGSTIVVDSELSEESENPVKNKIITVELEKKIETLDDDSQAPDAVNFDLDSELSLTSTKGVQNKVVKKALDAMEEEVKHIGTSVPNMTSDTNGIGRPDGTTIAVDEQGMFGIFENSTIEEYIVNDGFSLFNPAPIIQIGKIAIATFDMKCNNAIRNTDDILLISFCDKRLYTGNSIKPRLQSEQGFCCTASKTGLNAEDSEAVILPCKLVDESTDNYKIVSLYICKSDIPTDLSDYSYISGSVMWVTE